MAVKFMMHVTGASEIRQRIRMLSASLGEKFRRGLTKAGLELQRWSQKEVPVDMGTLKNSAGTRVIGAGWGSDAVVFYTAAYAVYVHERMDLKHPVGRAKFLEGPARERRDELLRIIEREVGV